MKLCSNSPKHFFIEASPGQYRTLLKSRDYEVSVSSNHLEIRKRSGDVILKEISYDELQDCEGNSFASIDDAVDYVLRVIDPDVDVNAENAILTRIKNGAEENIATANGTDISPVTFSYTAPSNRAAVITRIQLWLDEPNSNFSADDFGNGAALTNGIIVRVGGVDIALIKTNRDIATLLEVASTSFLTAANRSINAYTNIRTGLFIPRNSSFEFIVQDDLATSLGGAANFFVKLQGSLLN